MLTTVRATARRFVVSRWWRPASRVLLSAAGLLLLAVVGRFVVVGGQVPPAAAAVPEPLPPAPSALAAAPPADVEPAAGPDAAAPRSHSARATPDDPVYLNEATTDDLRRLPGIGPKRALAILSLRRRLGHFRQIEDLLRVRGIGRRTLHKLRPLVRLGSADAGVPVTATR